MSFPYNNVYAVTGSSGSGKTTVCKYLEELGAHIVYADAIAKKVVEKDTAGLNQLIKEFGPSFILEDGSLDRARLHEEIVKNENSKIKLESILHPLIASEAKRSFENLILENKHPIFYDCPLYFEKNLDKLGYKKSILITAPQNKKLSRLQARDNISIDLIQQRLDLQMPDEQKLDKADVIIENNSSLEELREEIVKLYTTIQANGF